MIISKSNKEHYVAIKSLSRLLSSENTKLKGKEYFCNNCSQGFKEESSRDEHIGYCIDNKSVKVEMPHKNPIVQNCSVEFLTNIDYFDIRKKSSETKSEASFAFEYMAVCRAIIKIFKYFFQLL